MSLVSATTPSSVHGHAAASSSESSLSTNEQLSEVLRKILTKENPNHGMIEHLPRGRGYLADQLQRVALSGTGTYALS